MSLFADLLSKIFSYAGVAPASNVQTSTPAAAATGPVNTGGAAVSAPPAAAPAAASSPTASPRQSAPVDVGAVLDGLAAESSESLDWKKSIVDLMKLVGMDSSLSSRKQLATELHYTGDMSDSATMNVWLHQEVLQKLSENGGKVPAELLKK